MQAMRVEEHYDMQHAYAIEVTYHISKIIIILYYNKSIKRFLVEGHI